MNNSIKETDEVSKEENKKRKRKEVFPYGNYKSYYGYRIGHEMDEDPRLKVFKREWFDGKDCLDIGCNSGIITIHIAKKFRCRSILGIDIDSDRIRDSHWHLKKVVRTENTKKSSKECAPAAVSKKMDCLEPSAMHQTKKPVKDGAHSQERDLFDVVSFRQENFVHARHTPETQYDTILCLSVTKWIHLNWGDDGIITLFSKIWKLLRQGGILVLEPQPWVSYVKKYHVSETAATNYRNITIRPENFQEILLDKIGFRQVEDITSSLSGSTAGFDRPIFVFRK